MQSSADLRCECVYLKTEGRYLVHKLEKRSPDREKVLQNAVWGFLGTPLDMLQR